MLKGGEPTALHSCLHTNTHHHQESSVSQNRHANMFEAMHGSSRPKELSAFLAKTACRLLADSCRASRSLLHRSLPLSAVGASAFPGFLFLLAATLLAIVSRGLLAGVAEFNEQVAR